MAKGQKTDNETIYKIMLSYCLTRNYAETSRKLNIPPSTVEKIVKENIEKPEFVKLWDIKKEEFIDNAQRIINKGTELLERRLDTALSSQQELEEMIYEIYSADKEEIKEQQKKSLVNKIMKLQVNSLSEITTAIGTIYDKQRIASGKIPSETTTPTLKIEIVDNESLEKVMYEDK